MGIPLNTYESEPGISENDSGKDHEAMTMNVDIYLNIY